MSKTRPLTRRAALSFAAAATAATAGGAVPAIAKTPAAGAGSAAAPAAAFGLEAHGSRDQSARLQGAIDQATARGAALLLPAGQILASNMVLRTGTRLVGATGIGSVLRQTGSGPVLTGTGVQNIALEHLTIDGARLPMASGPQSGLIALDECRDVTLTRITVRNGSQNGAALRGVSGRIFGCTFEAMKNAAIFSLDAAGLDLSHNVVSDCADNGILIWRSRHGEDGTLLIANRISRVRNASGGTGQYGNGINIYRAARVLASNNVISDCAYTAIRANEASNAQLTNNTVARIGEVALYAEAADERAGAAGFEGAVITGNVIDDAAAGIVVTNFNNGGRLAVVQGNLVRNLKRREQEAIDKRGEGIAIEADAVVSNNVIENAPTCGIMIGWGRHMREVVATGNLIRKARIGIAVTGDGAAGQCLLAHNMISETRDGAIRTMDHAKAIGADLINGRGPRNITLVGNIAT